MDFGEGSSRQVSTNVDGYRRRIDVAEKSEKFDECLEICREIEERSPSDKEIQLMKAKFLVLTGQFDAANEILSWKMKENAMNAEAIFILGLIFYCRGNLKKSVEVFDNALQIDPTMSHAKQMKIKATNLIAALQDITENYSEKHGLQTVIEDAMKIDPTNKEIMKKLRFHKAVFSYNSEKFRDAIENFTDALKFDEENSTLFMYRARCYLKLNLLDDVIVDLLEVDRFDKNEEFSEEATELRRQVGKIYVPKSNYDFLLISRTANEAEISQAFTSLSLLHKVNMSKATMRSQKRKLEFQFKRVENAHKILSDIKLRKKYDKQLGRHEESLEIAERRRICWRQCKTCTGECCERLGECFKGCCNGFGQFLVKYCKIIIGVIFALIVITATIGFIYYLWTIFGYWMIAPGFILGLLIFCCVKAG